MATIHVKRNHSLDKTHIRKEVEHLAEKLKEELSIDYQWDKDRLVFERTGANGFIQIGKNDVEIEIKLNLILTPLKGTIEKSITGYLDERLA
ncbi:MAG: polyhydroxyalkanoic acid system family protein [Gammaproteobacteria bacterium]|jgi:putative polyhydroxyalkanoate system protein